MSALKCSYFSVKNNSIKCSSSDYSELTEFSDFSVATLVASWVSQFCSMKNDSITWCYINFRNEYIYIFILYIFEILRIPEYGFRLNLKKKKKSIHLCLDPKHPSLVLQTCVVTQTPETKSAQLNLVCILKVHLM